jgi:hypothetical protein
LNNFPASSSSSSSLHHANLETSSATAAYHYITFSWILGGIVEAASGLGFRL